MDNQINYGINFLVNGNEVTAAVSKLGQAVVKTLGGITNSLKTIKLDAVLNQIDRVATGLGSLSKPGTDFSSSLSELSAITDVAGKGLEQIGEYARDASKEFGGSAADGVEGYKLVLSKLSPEIAKVPPALKGMGDSISILSKQMRGDTAGAADVLTTAMNQFQISTDDPIAASKTMAEMMNIMSAAAAAGSAELPEIKSALEQAGMAAKTAGVSFAETNAAIQVLDKAGKKGAEGGVAIRNVLATLSEGRFLPKETQKALQAAGVNMATLGNTSIPLADRLKALSPIMNDSALVTKLFGKENSNAAIALMSGIDHMRKWTTEITGTQDAMRQAAVIMDSPAEKAKRLQANVDDLKISLFNGTNGWLGYASVLGDATRDMTNLWPAVQVGGRILGGMGTVLKTVTSATKMYELGMKAGAVVAKVWTGVQQVFNAVMAAMPVVAIVLGIVAMIAVIGYVIYAFDGWGAAWGHLMDYLGASWSGFKESFNFIWLNVQDGFLTGIELIEKAWYHLKSLWDEDGAAAGLAKINGQQNDRGRAIAESYGKIAEYNQKADEAASKIFGKEGLHSNGKGVTDYVNAIKGKLGLGASSGIADNTGMPGAAGSGAAAGGAGAGGVGAAGSKTNQAIATGGTKNTTVYVTIGKQVERLEIHSANLREGVDKMQQTIIDGLTRGIVVGAALGGADIS